MTLNDGFERTVSDWLDEQAGHGMPGYLDEALARTTRTRQRPWWSSPERWLPVDLTAQTRSFARPTLGKALLVAAVLVALIGIAIIAVGSRVHRAPPPFGVAANGQIAYWANGDILVADADGTHAHAVITGPGDDGVPTYTRDGTQLAFLRTVSQHEATLMIASADGSGVRSVLKEPLTDSSWFDWSPDGRSLATVQQADGVTVLSVVDIEHGTIRDLNVNGLSVDYWVAYVPGTTSELMFGSRTGSGDSQRAGIYTIQADGSGLTPVVPPMTGTAEYKGVDLAPDGRTLTYWRWESATLPGRIHQLDIATGDDRVLRFDASDYGEAGLVHSPDGSRVLLSRNGAKLGQVMIAPADASRPGILVGRPFDKNGPQVGYGFSPDGKIVFVTSDGAVPQFFDAVTGAVRAGPSTPSNCCSWQRQAP
jgi:dipeptidyl aminopeptidase/acylaminoacyl peptidase